ncbi:protein FAM26F-like [Scleropages formosus]|uniref:Calcium homeostasis modulator family member 6 n=1 Tax=Scleropages formosus TaxID=113540 RepID=A0A0P7VVG4_SCLFO|nr:calcium homeostasis modulator protein 6 [Scleropages formosus]KPP78118.1 protein FAM26F-like [Scleropages formosus]
MDTKLKSLLSFVQKQQTSLGFGLVALLTAGGEQIFSSAVFRCPCSSWNSAYGTVFLLVPALVLLALGYILSNKTWKLFTGACQRRGHRSWRARRACACALVFLQVTTSALVAPVSWIAVALLNGNYFECAVTGINVTLFKEHLCAGKDPRCPDELYRFPCGKTSVPESERSDVLAIIRAESQVLGWLVIASIAVLALLLTCVARCTSPVSYLQLKFWREYTQKESSLLESYTAQHAGELAERNLKSFFQQTPPEPVVTPENKAWEKISTLYKFNSKHQYYSILHQYVETCNETDHRPSVRSEGGDAVNPVVLSFVDEGKMIP